MSISMTVSMSGHLKYRPGWVIGGRATWPNWKTSAWEVCGTTNVALKNDGERWRGASPQGAEAKGAAHFVGSLRRVGAAAR